jgi:hypothetical protein
MRWTEAIKKRKQMKKTLGTAKRTKKTKNGGIGKIGAPIRYKNKLYYPDIGDRKAQQALAKRYEAQAKKMEKIKRDLKDLEKYVVKN